MSTPDNKPLRAYTVHDGDDEWRIVFAKTNVAARRMGADRMDIDFSEVDSCKRSPEFDQYAPGPVPPQARIERGNWWYECTECSEHVTDETPEPAYLGQFVFCSKECCAYFEREKRDATEFEDMACELLSVRYPGAKLEYVERLKQDERVPLKLTFSFPGSRYSVTWTSGETTALVHPDDVDAFVALYRKSK